MKPSQIIWLLTALAAALRFYGLGQESLWVDELITWSRVQTGLWTILTDWDNQTQGPLYYIINKFWCALFGYSEASLRFTAAIYGTLAVPMIYHLGRKIFLQGTALFAALFLAVNPFAIHYSQDARPYSLFLLLSICSFYFVIKLLKQFRIKDAVLYAIVTAAALYTHPYGLFLLLCHAAAYFIYRREPDYYGARSDIKPFLITFFAAVALYLPQLIRFARSYLHRMDHASSSASWITEPSLFGIAAALNEYFMWSALTVTAFLILSVTAVIRYRSDRRRRAAILWMVSIIACMILLPWIVSKVLAPVFVPRYTIVALAAVLLLLGFSVAGFQGLPRTLMVSGLVLLTLLPLYHFYTKIDRDPWRQTVEYLKPLVHNGDVILPFPGWTAKHFAKYFDPPPAVRVERIEPATRIDSSLADANHVWLIESYEVKSINMDSIRTILSNNYIAGGTITINDQFEKNPYAYWVATITVTEYDKRAE